MPADDRDTLADVHDWLTSDLYRDQVVDPDASVTLYRLASENETDGLEGPGWDDIGDPDEQ